MSEKRSIGDLNGGWQILFRLTLVATPMVLGWIVGFSIWVVTNVMTLREFKAQATQQHISLASELLSVRSETRENRNDLKALRGSSQ